MKKRILVLILLTAVSLSTMLSLLSCSDKEEIEIVPVIPDVPDANDCTTIVVSSIVDEKVYATALDPKDFYHQFYYISFNLRDISDDILLQPGDIIDIHIIEYEEAEGLYITLFIPPIFCKVEHCK